MTFKFRQPIYENGRFFTFHFWGRNIEGAKFVAPVEGGTFCDVKDDEFHIGVKDHKGTLIYAGDKIRIQAWCHTEGEEGEESFNEEKLIHTATVTEHGDVDVDVDICEYCCPIQLRYLIQDEYIVEVIGNIHE